MRITLGLGVTRAGVDETITGLWTFANVLGLLTDIIGERSSGAGVTVDGLLIRDSGIPEAAVTAHEAALAILESQITDGSILARIAAAEVITGGWTFNSSVEMRAVLEMNDFASGSNAVFRTDVVGDSVERFALHVNGIMQWGDGFSTRDVNLFRAAANELATDDDFNVGGTLDLDGNIEFGTDSVVPSGTQDNFAVADKIFIRVSNTASVTFTGFTGGVDGRFLIIYNVGVFTTVISDDDAGSTAANRILTSTGSNIVLSAKESVLLVYDGTSSRWRELNLV